VLKCWLRCLLRFVVFRLACHSFDQICVFWNCHVRCREEAENRKWEEYLLIWNEKCWIWRIYLMWCEGDEGICLDFFFCQPQEKTSDGIRMIKDHNLREGKGWWQWCEVCEKEGNAALWMLLSFIFADVAECRYESDTVVETSLMQNIIVTESQQKLQWMWKSSKIMSVLKRFLETTLCESIEGKIQGSNSCH